MMAELYPEISKFDTFFELFQEAFVWSFLQCPFIWLSVVCLVFYSKYFVVFFHRKIVIYSLLCFIPLFVITLPTIALINNEKPSNYLLYGIIFLVPIVVFGLLMFIQSSRFKNTKTPSTYRWQKKINLLGSKFQELSFVYQILFYTILVLLIFSFHILLSKLFWRSNFSNSVLLLFSLSTLFLFSIYVLVLFNKMKKLKGIKMKYKSSDYYPLIIILVIFGLISMETIGDMVCSIPKFNSYFSSVNCR